MLLFGIDKEKRFLFGIDKENRGFHLGLIKKK
jgi:hypothetical protein